MPLRMTSIPNSKRSRNMATIWSGGMSSPVGEATPRLSSKA
jgi:hypothetical protein